MALHKEEAGSRLAESRDLAGLTQQEAADAIDVDKRTIQRYEAGDIGKMATIQALADTYGMTVEEMLGDEEFTPRSSRRLSDRLDALEAAVDETRAAVGELLLRTIADRDERLSSAAAERVRQAALRSREVQNGRTQAGSDN